MIRCFSPLCKFFSGETVHCHRADRSRNLKLRPCQCKLLAAGAAVCYDKARKEGIKWN